MGETDDREWVNAHKTPRTVWGSTNSSRARHLLSRNVRSTDAGIGVGGGARSFVVRAGVGRPQPQPCREECQRCGSGNGQDAQAGP